MGMVRLPSLSTLSLIGLGLSLSIVAGCSFSPKKKRDLAGENQVTKQTPVPFLTKEPESPTFRAEVKSETVKKERPYDSSWSYRGGLGPHMWGDLDEKYATCKTGMKQSPVDLRWSRPTEERELNINYKPSRLRIVDNGHTIQVNADPGSVLNVNGKTYELTYIHFHSQSEHTISGKYYPMEMHLIHKSKDGELAIIGRMLTVGDKPNSTIAKIWFHLPERQFYEVEALNYTIDFSALIPKARSHYNYEGSLTTPPCTQGVDWNFFNTPLEISKEQLYVFRTLHPNNYRPIQPLNGRHPINY